MLDPAFPNGHFYSPVVDPDKVESYVARNRLRPVEKLGSIKFRPTMVDSFLSRPDLFRIDDFPRRKEPGRRFYVENGNFPPWDAAVLRAMLGMLRPSRVIEIGSGFSTACMLDAADEFDIDVRVTCIDPDCSRLRSIMTAADSCRVEVIEREVQEVGEDVVAALGAGDFLFIDSSHVLKAGSDVHYELFYLLPRLPVGAYVHFHDVRFPFEYSDHMLKVMRVSWNEAYGLHAFLSFNSSFEVYYWNGMVQSLLAAAGVESPLMADNAGSSIWLRRVA